MRLTEQGKVTIQLKCDGKRFKKFTAQIIFLTTKISVAAKNNFN